jgi:hypothetical protein
VTGHPIADPDRDRIFERDAEDDYRAERGRTPERTYVIQEARDDLPAIIVGDDAYTPDSVPAAAMCAVELLREWADDWMTPREAVAARRLAADVHDEHLRFL